MVQDPLWTKDATQVKSTGDPIGKGVLGPEPRTLAQMRKLYRYLVGDAMVVVDSPLVQNLLHNIEDKGPGIGQEDPEVRKRLTNAIKEFVNTIHPSCA